MLLCCIYIPKAHICSTDTRLLCICPHLFIAHLACGLAGIQAQELVSVAIQLQGAFLPPSTHALEPGLCGARILQNMDTLLATPSTYIHNL